MQLCPCYAPGGKVYVPLLGENLLPEVVNSQRRSMRRRVRDIRDPIRNFRESNIPGPDLVGQIENTLVNARDNFVSSDRVMSRLQGLRSDGFNLGRNGNGIMNGDGNNNNGSSSGEVTRRTESNNPTLQ